MESLKQRVEKKFDMVYVNTREIVEMDSYDLVPVEIHDDNFHALDVLMNFVVSELGHKLVVHSKPNKETQFYIKVINGSLKSKTSEWGVYVANVVSTTIIVGFHLVCIIITSSILYGADSAIWVALKSYFGQVV